MYEYFLGQTAAEGYRNLCIVFGANTPTKRTFEPWFNKFKDGIFSIEDEPRTGRPIEVKHKNFLI